MSIETLKQAGTNGFLSGILVLTGITFVSANVGFFPPLIVLIGLTLIIGGLACGAKAAYFLFLYYKKGEFF